MEEFQEKLKDAKGDDFHKVLEAYELKQLEVEKELEKQRAKEDDQLDRKLKERRAKIKAAAQLRKAQEFAKLEEEAKAKNAKDEADKAQLMENLKNVEQEDDLGYDVDKLGGQLDNEQLMEDAELKKRNEEAFRLQMER